MDAEDEIMTNLRSIAFNEEEKAADRLKAIELLIKYRTSFREEQGDISTWFKENE